MLSRFVYGLASCALFAIDRGFKEYIQAYVRLASSPTYPYGGIGIFHNWCGGIDFSINHVTNTGAAWGIFSGVDKVLLVLRIILILGLGIYLFFFNKQREKELPFVLILTGAIGNVVDYFTYGHVVDMFHFSFWGHSFAVFNVADATIFCGVVFLMLLPLWEKLRHNWYQR